MSRNSRQSAFTRMTRRPHIEPALLALLNANTRDSFTVSSLTQAYRALPNSPRPDAKAARQFIARNVTRLMQHGFLRCVSGADETPRYIVTGSADTPSPTHGDAPSLRHLRDKLHQCQVDLLTTLGETEEYDTLCAELPDLRPAAQRLYDEARDRSAKTLGRVRALESLIAAHVSA